MDKALKHGIPWEEARKELFTPKELHELDKKIRFRIAMRHLREERKKRGITQEKLATLSGLARSSISKIESGYNNVSIRKIMKLADALDMDVEVVLAKRNNS